MLTDFLVRSFARTVLQELGLDRWPELRDGVLRALHARWCGWPRSRTTSCGAWPTDAADRLGLPLTVVETGDSGLERALAAVVQG